ncbi:MAG: tetratricopeptide repeat protein [Deltaproteobacteria bacterium]|nr:tetratricopeptide repeat protein [Deltaproteobacteria bacterium]
MTTLLKHSLSDKRSLLLQLNRTAGARSTRLRVFFQFSLMTLLLLSPQYALAQSALSKAISPKTVGPLLKKAHKALDEWRLADGRDIATNLQRALPDIPAVQELMGRVKFHEGDYEGALKLLQRASEGGSSSSFLSLAETTFAETKDSVTFESEHFRLRVPRGKDEVLQEPALWALEKAYDEVTRAFNYRPAGKIPVDVLHDARGLASVSSLTVQEIETSGTIALCKYNRLMITSPKALARGYGWLDTLAHELIHLVISEKSHNQVPIWLHEGLAKYSESLWRGKPGLALHPASESLLAAAVKKKQLITFEQMHPSMAKLPSQNDTALAFAEVFTVIEFLHQKKRKKRMGYDVTNALIVALRDGLSMNRALKKSVGWNLSGLQGAWKRYLKKRKFRIVAGAKPKQLRFVRDARIRENEVDEHDDQATQDEAKGAKGSRFVRLGNLLRGRGHKRAALVEYEKALLWQKSTSPLLQNRVAQLYLEQGRLDDAVKLLQKSLKTNPDDAHTHILFGRANLMAKQYEKAKKHYLQARWENPFHPEIDQALYQIADATSDAALLEKSKQNIRLLRSRPAKAAALEHFGTVDIKSAVWANVFVDGKALYRTTPIADLQLLPGLHVVRVESPTEAKADFSSVTIVEAQASRLSLEPRTTTVDDENIYQALLQKRKEALKDSQKKARREEHSERGLTGIPFADFEASIEQVEDSLADNKAYRAYNQLLVIKRQLDDEVEDNAYQRAWLVVLEVESLTLQRRFDEAIVKMNARSKRSFAKLPMRHSRRLYKSGLESLTEKGTPQQVLTFALYCADEGKRAQTPEVSAECLLIALTHLESIRKPKLNEIAATRLSALGRKYKQPTWEQEAARALLLNHQQTKSAHIKATLLGMRPTILSLPGTDPVLLLLQKSLNDL